MVKNNSAALNLSSIPENSTITGILLWGFIHAERTHIILKFLVLIFLVGMLANLLIINIICMQKSLQTPKNFLICELCAVDLYRLVTSCSYFFAIFARVTLSQFCLVQYYFLIVHNCFQVFTITIMVIDRYYVIFHPFQCNRKVTNELTIKILSVPWVFALTYPLIYVLSFWGQKSCCLVNSYSFFPRR